MRSLQFRSSPRSRAFEPQHSCSGLQTAGVPLADVAVGVSADRPAATHTHAAFRIHAHGRHRGRPLQELRIAEHRPSNKRISIHRDAANCNPVPELRARRTRTQKDHRHLLTTDD